MSDTKICKSYTDVSVTWMLDMFIDDNYRRGPNSFANISVTDRRLYVVINITLAIYESDK